MDALKFFQNSSGKWRSQRTTHHLAFRRAEIGDSEIYVEALEADNPKIIEIQFVLKTFFALRPLQDRIEF